MTEGGAAGRPVCRAGRGSGSGSGPGPGGSRSQRDETLANFDLSDFEETGFGEPTDDELAAKAPHIDGRGLARTMWTTCWPSSGWSPPSRRRPSGIPARLALADFEDASPRWSPIRGGEAREQVQDSDFVEIDKLLADADASQQHGAGTLSGLLPGCGAGRFPRGAAGSPTV